MSLKTKKKFKNIGKIFAGVLFALLLFTNIKVAFMDDAEILSGDISLLGVELTLFEATYACRSDFYCYYWHPSYDCSEMSAGCSCETIIVTP